MQAATCKLLVPFLLLPPAVRAFASRHYLLGRRRYSSFLRPAIGSSSTSTALFTCAVWTESDDRDGEEGGKDADTDDDSAMSFEMNNNDDEEDKGGAEEEECDIEAPPGFCTKFDDFGSPVFEKNGDTVDINGSSAGIPVVKEPSKSNEEQSAETTATPKTKSPCIRLQALPDACLEGITTASDVEEKIRQVREYMSECRRSDLYERHWIPTNSTNVDDEYDDDAYADDDRCSNTFHINAMQFNTLAEGLSSAATKALPFGKSKEHKKNEKGNGYGGFTEVPEPDKCLDYALRRWRIIEVIIGKCYKESSQEATATSCAFDLVAMEEVDRFAGFFEPTLAKFGYRGIFAAKPHAPGIDLGWYSDGCALFYREEVFEMLDEKRGSYRRGTQVYLLATLKHKETGRVIIVAVTHLKASASKQNERIRTQQAVELVDILANKSSEVAASSDGLSESGIIILIMGDFNSEPSGEGRTAVRSVVEREESPRLASAYPLDLSFSTWKTRGENSVKRVIDYIFHNTKDVRAFECTDILDLPSEEEMEPHRLPGFRYPSDHLALAARFRIRT